MSAPLPPEVLSPSQFAYSQTSTLGTEGQNITDSSATNGQLSAVPLLPPPPPPPPPPMPGPNDVPPLRSQSGPKQADASSASGGDNPLPNSQKKNKTTLMFVEELDQKLKAKDKKLAGSAQKAADQKSDNAQDATDATLKKLQQHVGASKEDKDLKKLHDDLKEVTDVAAYLNLQTLKTDAEALEDEDNLTLLKKAAKVVDSLDGFKLSEKARLILKKAAETGALPTNFHKIVEEAFNEEEKAKEMSNLIGLALQYLEPQKVVSPAPDGAHNDKQKTLGGLLLKRLNTNSSRPSLQEALGRMKQRWATASDADDFYDNDAKAQQLKDLLPKALVLSEVMETVKKTQAELAAKLAAQTTAQSAAPQREESAKGEPVKKPPQAPEQSSGNQEPTTLKEQLAAVLKPGQKPLRPSKPAAETSSSALSQMPSLDPEPSEEPSAYEEDLYERLKREKAAQAEAEKANAENQQPQTAAEVFGGTKLKKRTPHAGGVKVL
ncbi:MAG: hypothetical protein ACPGUZ_03475 [Holosporaceae bacterium]